MNGGEVDEGRLIVAVHGVVDRVVRIARTFGPLPPLRSEAFLSAPTVVQLAVLLVLGEAWLTGDGVLDTWLTDDFPGGRYHRPHHLIPAVGQLARVRYPPTGDRDMWIRYGPDGPPIGEGATA